MKSFVGLAAAIGVTLTLFVVGASAGNSDATPGGGVDTTSAIVQLKGDPISTYPKTKPAPGKKIDWAGSNVKSYRAYLSSLRNDFKKWLAANAPAAKVTGEFDIAVNAVSVDLNGTSLDTLRSAPQVASASYEALYQPTAIDPDLSLISAFDAWRQVGGASNAGAGTVVGVVDTGIDIKSPCFADSNPSNDGAYTNDKVLSAGVYYMRAKVEGLDAKAVQAHGTHVAGTIACNYDTSPVTVGGALIPYAMSGVAPAAKLRSYNVFPGNVASARSEDILNALEAAAADGVDVINMSLGGGASGIQDLLTMAVDDLDQAGIVMAIAAGNDGPGHYTVGSPGSAERALTAGASTVGHFVTAQIKAPSGTYNAATGDFATVSADTTAVLAAASGTGAAGLSQACSALSGSYTGMIVLVARGGCTFSTKVWNIQNAGGAAAVVVNNVAGDPIAMGFDTTFATQPTIPAYMLSLADGTAIKADAGTSVTIPVNQTYVVSGKDDIMAGFSSQGPTDVDFRVKPDVVAPGVNVLSSIPVSYCGGAPCYAFFQGTSMATPHLAGSAAVVKAANPTWSAAQIRSAIVNTADQGVLKSSSASGLEADVNIVGAGRENLASAVSAGVALDPVSVSFGAVPSGSGQSATKNVDLSTLDGYVGPYSAQVTGTTGSGVTFAVAPTSSGFAVTMDASKGAGLGDHQAMLRIYRGDTEVAHAVLYVFIKK